jgi:xanthine dehydrogenase iron-sulfur cluster and FAD-binding subunit A
MKTFFDREYLDLRLSHHCASITWKITFEWHMKICDIYRVCPSHAASEFSNIREWSFFWFNFTLFLRLFSFSMNVRLLHICRAQARAPLWRFFSLAASSGLKESALRLIVNGEEKVIVNPKPSLSLLDYLRDTGKLRGTKYGCGEGGCGACTVTLTSWDPVHMKVIHRSIDSCLTPLCSLDQCVVTTVEGIGSKRTGMHQIQEEIAHHHGSQCGFCTPGVVMSAYSALCNHEHPTIEDFEDGLDGNLCRCTGYRPIIDALKKISFCTPFFSLQQEKERKKDKAQVLHSLTAPSFFFSVLCSLPSLHGDFLLLILSWHISSEKKVFVKPSFPEHFKTASARFLHFVDDSSTTEWLRPTSIDQLLALTVRAHIHSNHVFSIWSILKADVQTHWSTSSPTQFDGKFDKIVCVCVCICGTQKSHPEAKIVLGNTELGVQKNIGKIMHKYFIDGTAIPSFRKVCHCPGVFSALDLTLTTQHTDTLLSHHIFLPFFGFLCLKIFIENGTLHIAAAVTLTELRQFLAEQISAKSLVAGDWNHELFKAIDHQLRYFAGTQIRNVASVVGNLVTASPTSDLNPIWLSNKSVVKTMKAGSVKKSIPIRDFFVSYRKVRLDPGEVIVGLGMFLPHCWNLKCRVEETEIFFLPPFFFTTVDVRCSRFPYFFIVLLILDRIATLQRIRIRPKLQTSTQEGGWYFNCKCRIPCEIARNSRR